MRIFVIEKSFYSKLVNLLSIIYTKYCYIIEALSRVPWENCLSSEAYSFSFSSILGMLPPSGHLNVMAMTKSVYQCITIMNPSFSELIYSLPDS